MILICNEITDYSSYAKNQSPRAVKSVGINANEIITIRPLELWKSHEHTIQITEVNVGGTAVYLEHSFEEVRAMLFGMTLVHDYRVEHGTHFVKSEPYMIPEEEDEDSCF
jgi:hypothetical protein